MTVVGTNEIYRWENLVRPFLVHKLLPPPPPHPPLFLMLAWGGGGQNRLTPERTGGGAHPPPPFECLVGQRHWTNALATAMRDNSVQSPEGAYLVPIWNPLGGCSPVHAKAGRPRSALAHATHPQRHTTSEESVVVPTGGVDVPLEPQGVEVPDGFFGSGLMDRDRALMAVKVVA